MTGLARCASATGAALATAGIVFGVPVALWLLARPLLEPLLGNGLPSSGTLLDLMLRPDDGTLLMAFLVLFAAGAWLVLTISIIAELVAALTHRPTPRINLPGFRLGHSIAAALVAAILGAGPAMAAPVTAAAITPLVATAPSVDSPAVSSQAQTEAERAGPVHIVAPRDTLWRIAETTLGDPLRWREIYDLNAGRIQADGTTLTEASALTVGWRLVLPADAHDVVRVEPGNTLTELAAEHLGSPGRADEIFAANAGRPQPGGATLTDPNLLRPGWTLTIPGPQAHPDAPPAASATPAPAPTPAPSTPTPSIPTPTTAVEPPTSPPALPTGPVTPPAGHTEPAPAAAAPAQTDSAGPGLTVGALGISTLVVGGFLAALAVRRRRQLRHRPARHRIAVPADELGQLEWSATRTEPTSSTRHLDLALRSLAHPDHGITAAPQLESARLTPQDVLLTVLDETPLPAPFTATGEPRRWGLDADDPLPVPASEAAGCCAPFPTLASIATDTSIDTGRTLMIDLEQRQVLRIGGDHERCVALLRHLAAELATSRTAEDTEVLLVGLGDELAALNPDQLLVSDIDSALTELEHRANATQSALTTHQTPTVIEGRLRNLAADSWLPTVLLVGHEPDDAQRGRIDELAAAEPGTTAVAIVVLDPTTAELRIDEDGVLTLPDIDDGPWRAAQLTEEAGTSLAAILAATAAPPIPVGPGPVDQTWGSGMNEDGSLALDDGGLGELHQVGMGPVEIDHDAVRSWDDETSGDKSDDEHQDDDDPRTAGVVDESDPSADEEDGFGSAPSILAPRPPIDPESARRLAIVDHQDPHLDDDLAAWNAPGVPEVPMIAVLGEPAVRAPGAVPKTRPSWFAEVLVYLSLHPGGVTAAKAATDLWPDGHRISPATIRHAFYGARRWAGRGLDGDPEATFVSDMQTDSTYRLRGHLLDWDLFRRLRKRGHARHAAQHPGATADYEAALALVRGPILRALRPGGYAWLGGHDQRHDLQIPGFVVDAAHELVDIALAAGDTALARRAAEQARMVDTDVTYDRPLTDLMRIAHAEDNQSELELYAAVLLDARGFDVPEELAPDTFAVLNDLLPAGPRRPRS